MKQTVNDVEIRDAMKKFGSNIVLDGINLDVKQGELITLLGPSGCGKTTTLNLIAGFIEADKGEIYIKGKKVNNVPPYKRDLGMVFQTYSLFPHMTVYENLDFGLSMHKVPKEEKKKRITEVLELVRMSGLEERYPREMSGGQRQRVAIARALVVQPNLLLLDEPLSNLDAKLRHELRAEIKRLQKEVGVTTIFVTHDQEEALSLSDRIVVMNKGKIEQIGTPSEIYNQPATEFVYQFIGKSNSLTGKIISIDENMIKVKIENNSEVLINKNNRMDKQKNYNLGDTVQLYIRPEKIEIKSKENNCTNENFYIGKITQLNYLGINWEIEVLMKEITIQILSPVKETDWAIGSEVLIGWKPSDVMIVKK